MLLLPDALLFLACPHCTYNRLFPTWILFASLRLLVVLAASYRRLDLVRTLGAFVLFEVAYYYAWREAVWYSHPAVAEGPVAWAALAGLIILTIGIPAAILLHRLSRVPYFRQPGAEPFTPQRALLLTLPAMITLDALQGFSM